METEFLLLASLQNSASVVFYSMKLLTNEFPPRNQAHFPIILTFAAIFLRSVVI